MTVVNVDYEFNVVAVGDMADSDGTTINNDDIDLPRPRCNDQKIPFAFIGDDAFLLKPSLMKPIPDQNLAARERIYNC